MDPEVVLKGAEEAIGVMESVSSLINTNEEYNLIQKIVQDLESLVDDCLVHQKKIHVCIQACFKSREYLQSYGPVPELKVLEKGKLYFRLEPLKRLAETICRNYCTVQSSIVSAVKAKELRILDAQKSNLKDEELEELRNNLAEARIEEEKARATARSMEEHLDGLAEQLQSVEAQKLTLAALASEEAQLKSELSLFSTISGIIPNMAKIDVFAGTLLDNEDVTEFTLDPKDMSDYQLSKTIWDMIR